MDWLSARFDCAIEHAPAPVCPTPSSRKTRKVWRLNLSERELENFLLQNDSPVANVLPQEQYNRRRAL